MQQDKDLERGRWEAAFLEQVEAVETLDDLCELNQRFLESTTPNPVPIIGSGALSAAIVRGFMASRMPQSREIVNVTLEVPKPGRFARARVVEGERRSVWAVEAVVGHEDDGGSIRSVFVLDDEAHVWREDVYLPEPGRTAVLMVVPQGEPVVIRRVHAVDPEWDWRTYAHRATPGDLQGLFFFDRDPSRCPQPDPWSTREGRRDLKRLARERSAARMKGAFR